MHDYVQEIKSLADALASINAPIDDSDLVAITLNVLGKEYKSFDTSIAVRGGNPPDFDELCSLLITEEMKLGLGTSSSTSTNARDQAFYSRGARGRGRFSLSEDVKIARVGKIDHHRIFRILMVHEVVVVEIHTPQAGGEQV